MSLPAWFTFYDEPVPHLDYGAPMTSNHLRTTEEHFAEGDLDHPYAGVAPYEQDS